MERMMGPLILSAVPNPELALTRTSSVSITNCNMTAKPIKKIATESAHIPCIHEIQVYQWETVMQV